MSAISPGDVAITLDSEPSTLRCTLRANKEVNAFFGSFTEAYRRVSAYDFNAFVAIVAAGLGKSPKDIEQSVYKNGMHSLVKPLTTYLELLSNGGRPVSPKPEGDASGED